MDKGPIIFALLTLGFIAGASRASKGKEYGTPEWKGVSNWLERVKRPDFEDYKLAVESILAKKGKFWNNDINMIMIKASNELSSTKFTHLIQELGLTSTDFRWVEQDKAGASKYQPKEPREKAKAGNPGIDWKPKFVMYHATPIKNLESVKQTGIWRSVPELPRTRLSPTEPVVYFANDVGNVIDYAEQSWEYHRMTDPRWAIFKIEYDEFPVEPHADIEWGLPGIYWANIDIPPEHVKLHGIFDVEQHKWIHPTN